MYGYGSISIKEKQFEITEIFIYSTSTSSTKEEEDFIVQLAIDEYTRHVSNDLKLSFITSVLDYPIPWGNLGCFYFVSSIL
jgi:hypothetical protein